MKLVMGIVVAALVALAALILPVSAQDPEPDIIRVVRTYGSGPVAASECIRTEQEVLCSTSVPDAVNFIIPSEVGRVDLTATLTVQYRTSQGDGARLTATLNQAGEFRPRTFQLGTDSLGDSTTVTWISPNLDASVDPYEFRFEIGIVRNNPLPARSVVSEAVLVLTATPG